ncbi:MAG TPA: carboxypeptidase-like regulatory domain-containing protein, partial [Blastocatellia bacterium]|nr:carboxypeptidase-like regulatory domain-containing protein [Blastocatellia bacterium]
MRNSFAMPVAAQSGIAGRTLLITAMLLLLPGLFTTVAQTSKPPQNRDNRPAAEQGKPSRSSTNQPSRGTLSGKVIGDGGQPLQEASVMAIPAGSASSTSAFSALGSMRTALTDETGAFVIGDIRPGAYTLLATIPGFVTEAQATGKPIYYRQNDSATIHLVKGGVITGSVTSQSGEPIVGIRVRAIALRDLNGRPLRFSNVTVAQMVRDWKTDDRGIYRIFGLEAASYVVSAGGRGVTSFGSFDLYDTDAPTFYPSATRDTAVEVKVRTGEEATGIDIRFRETKGPTISGTLAGPSKPGPMGLGPAAMVTLTDAASGSMMSLTIAGLNDSMRSFEFNGVPNGTYWLAAVSIPGAREEAMASASRRVEVKDSDVTGVELALRPLSSIAGRLVMEKAPAADPKACRSAPGRQLSEAVIVARRSDSVQDGVSSLLLVGLFGRSAYAESVPDDKGDFRIKPLQDGRYRVDADLADEAWYIRAISAPGANPDKPVDVARNGIALKPGEQFSAVTVTVAEGAEGIR